MHIPGKSTNCFSLFDLNEYIKQVLALNFSNSVWVQAEVMQVKFSRGHCYLELIQKGEDSEEVVAQAQAVIWARQTFILQSKLGVSFDALLQPGMEVQLLVEVSFHERYGLKLIVQDIDETYTWGKLELLRRETILKLQKLGLLERNKAQELPSVIQKIAVISSPDAAGYKDFINQLGNNAYGYRYNLTLFPSAMQGSKVVDELIAQLNKIKEEKFDTVVIIRGGGAKLDLAAFDAFNICEAVAKFHLPVLTGIGHEVDETVLDIVAHQSLKTPTAVAEYLILHNMQFEASILDLGREIHHQVQELIHDNSKALSNTSQFVRAECRRILDGQSLMLDFIEKELPAATRSQLRNCDACLENLSSQVSLLDPKAVLRRGFSMVMKDGKVVRNASQLVSGDEIETSFIDGTIRSTVN